MDAQDAKSLVGERRVIKDGRKNRPLRWPQGVYDAILQLQAENPRMPINGDFLKSVNEKCISGINVNGINSWWGRHLREQREGSSGTSTSPVVQKEKEVNLKRKAAQLDSSVNVKDPSEDEGAGEDGDVERQTKVYRNSSISNVDRNSSS